MKPHAPLRRSEMTATCFPRDESHTHKMQQKRQATEKYTHFDISYIIIQDKKTHRHGCADKQSECKHLTLTAVTSMWGQEGASRGWGGSSYTAHCGGFKHSTSSWKVDPTSPSLGHLQWTGPERDALFLHHSLRGKPATMLWDHPHSTTERATQ